MILKTLQGMLLAALLVFSHAMLAGQSVNINTANAEELSAALDGIGDARAEAIVSFREEHGDFLSADDLSLVSGIGETTVDRNRDRIQVEE